MCLCGQRMASQRTQVQWSVVGARGVRDIGWDGLVVPFGLCWRSGVRVRRAVQECQMCWKGARASAKGVGECCVRCGERGGRGRGAL